MTGEAEICISAHDARETFRRVPATLSSSGISEVFDDIVESARLGPVPPATPTPAAAASPTAAPPPTPANCATPTDADCIRAVYRGAPEDYAQVVDIPADLLLTPDADGRYRVERGQQYTVVTAAPLPAGWTRFWLDLSPLEFGTPSPVSASQLIKPVGTTYTFTVTEDEAASTLITFDLKQARPFVRPRPDGKPEIGDTVVTTVFSVETSSPRYNSYDTTGAVATAGSYAFLSDPADTTSAVTTYEALRDGTTTALLIHKSDAHGASQAALYDAVEAGDLFEWHEADDCFVRYKVTEVKPDPTGTVPRKLLAVEWMTYAFTGCSGAVPANGAATVDWGELPDLGGTSLTAPAVHGIYQFVPADWDGDTLDWEYHVAPRYSEVSYTEDIAVARTLDFWREPTVPENWMFGSAWSGGGDSTGPESYGYCALWLTEERRFSGADHPYRNKGFRICGYYAIGRLFQERASWGNQVVTETRVIAGRPARLVYSPAGPDHVARYYIDIAIYDPQTETEYTVSAEDWTIRSNPEAVIAILRSLFEGD